jgi:hypothetical protein
MPRELVEPHKGDKRYVRRGKKGQFTSRQTNVGRSLAADRRSKAKTTVKKGEGDRRPAFRLSSDSGYSDQTQGRGGGNEGVFSTARAN